ncbi:MAG: TatD family hydrolase [Bdellovibrionales bacterium]|jgi:TatD DNase family protein
MLIDSHCHLDDEALVGDLDGVVARACAAGVGRIVTVGCSRFEFAPVLAIAEKYDVIDVCLGVHPHEAEKEGQLITTEELIRIEQHPKVIGLGETGLDYHYDFAPRDAQQRNFRQHIRAAIQTGLPLVIHTREAEEDTIRLLKEEGAGQQARLTGVLHCFSSKREMATYGLEIGFYVSFSGMITFNKSEDIRAIAADVPMDRLLIETDAPYLAPIPHRGKTCEPAHVALTAKKLAEVKGVSVEAIEKATTENFFRLFGKAKA